METKIMLQKIEEEFPQIKWRNVRRLKKGWDFDVIVLDQEKVFRFPKKKYLKEALQREMDLLSYLRDRVNVRIPEYEYVSKDRSFAGYNFIEGEPLTPACFKKLSASEKEVIVKQLSRFISVLHSIPIFVGNELNIESHDQMAFYKEFVEDVEELVFPRMNENEVSVVEQYFVKLKEALGYEGPKVLLHDDLQGKNILWDSEEERIGIIDFGDCVFGDPAVDFAELLGYGLDFTKEVLRASRGEMDMEILKRAKLYFKITPLRMMKDSLQGRPCTFEEGYEMFRERFKV